MALLGRLARRGRRRPARYLRRSVFARNRKPPCTALRLARGSCAWQGPLARRRSRPACRLRFWAALGQAAGAMAGTGDEAAKTALQGMKTGEDVQGVAGQNARRMATLLQETGRAACGLGGIDPASPQGQPAVSQALAAAPVRRAECAATASQARHPV